MLHPAQSSCATLHHRSLLDTSGTSGVTAEKEEGDKDTEANQDNADDGKDQEQGHGSSNVTVRLGQTGGGLGGGAVAPAGALGAVDRGGRDEFPCRVANLLAELVGAQHCVCDMQCRGGLIGV